MKRAINRVVVIGTGVMGSQIAAHLANVGIQTWMIDIVPSHLTTEEQKKGLTLQSRKVRNRIAETNKRKLKTMKPSPITSDKSLKLLFTGNLEDDLNVLSKADWIIEAVVENLDIKKDVWKKIDAYRKAGTLTSTNTSGISVEKIIAECSKDLRKHFVGTHFFNPPRYLKLLEIIPAKDTDPNVVQFIKSFAENKLGKGVVEAKNTPNFIANRIGTYGLLITVREMITHGYRIGEVDSITGRLIGRPKSATFRTLDIVGLDTFIYVANNVRNYADGDEKEVFTVPAFIRKMQRKGWIGSKNGQGFYKKVKKNGENRIYELNIHTFEYEERTKLSTPAMKKAFNEKTVEGKLKALVYASEDRAGDFLWNTLKRVLLYSARLVGEICDNIQSIDQAMKWGFGWELGPFEIWDAIGVRHSIKRMKREGEQIPDWIQTFVNNGNETFYKKEGEKNYYYSDFKYVPYKRSNKELDLYSLKQAGNVVKSNRSASLVDLGDGVVCLEFHSKNNAIGLDTIHMINESIELVQEKFEGLIIGNQGSNFCVGANLALLLMEAQDENYFELELVVRQFQKMTMNIKYAEKPIVVAPFNMTLGGGAEVTLPAAAVQASIETYIGLVEFGVGLIPGGGGTKELYLKRLRNAQEQTGANLLNLANHVYETIAMAKVSSSAQEGFEYGFFNASDKISVHSDHLLFDAKQKVISMVERGYAPPQKETIPVVGNAGYAAMLLGAKTLHVGGYASDHDLKIAEKLAYVLSGGRIKEGAYIDEELMLDLEREAFLSLIGEPKTQARMQHMLLKGKPLRN